MGSGGSGRGCQEGEAHTFLWRPAKGGEAGRRGRNLLIGLAQLSLYVWGWGKLEAGGGKLGLSLIVPGGELCVFSLPLLRREKLQMAFLLLLLPF